jgi:hypothetical protein
VPKPVERATTKVCGPAYLFSIRIFDRALHLGGQDPVVLGKPGKQVSLCRVGCAFGDPFAAGSLSAKLFQMRLHVPHPDAPAETKLVGSRSTLRTSNIASKIMIGR